MNEIISKGDELFLLRNLNLKGFKRRTKGRVRFDILDTINDKGRIKITNLLQDHKVNLSYILLKKHLDSLISDELIINKEENVNNVYIIITEKGRDRLDQCKNIVGEMLLNDTRT